MIAERRFGRRDGQAVREMLLEDGPVRVAVLNYGCVIRDWRVGGRPMVLGFDRFEDYPAHSPAFGIVAGRVANRIARGRFRLGGREWMLPCNDGLNHLHGGPAGLGTRIWDMEADSARRAIRLSLLSPDGDGGYPGAVRFTVEIRLEGTRLSWDMTGLPDRETPINLAQHNYYNLAGTGDVRGHRLRIAAGAYTPVDGTQIPTGEIRPVDGTRFDFRRARRLEEADPEGLGQDHNLVLSPRDPGADPGAGLGVPAAEVEAAGHRLRLFTDQPGLQLFTARDMDIPVPGLDGRRYGRFGGLCLEAQGFPDAVNQPGFPVILHGPERPYRQRLSVEIAPL